MARRSERLLTSGIWAKTCLSMPMASGLKLRKTSKFVCSSFSRARGSTAFSVMVSGVFMVRQPGDQGAKVSTKRPVFTPSTAFRRHVGETRPAFAASHLRPPPCDNWGGSPHEKRGAHCHRRGFQRLSLLHFPAEAQPTSPQLFLAECPYPARHRGLGPAHSMGRPDQWGAS